MGAIVYTLLSILFQNLRVLFKIIICHRLIYCDKPFPCKLQILKIRAIWGESVWGAQGKPFIDHVERSFIISWGSTINITDSVNKFMVSVRFFTDSPLVSNSIFLSFQLKYSSYKNSGLCYRKRFWIRRFEYFFVMFPCSGSKLLNKIFFGTISIFTYTHWYTNVTVSLST